MRIGTFVWIFIQKKRSNESNTSTNITSSAPEDETDLLILSKHASLLEQLKNIKGPKLLHVITTKGKGLKKAEEDQVKY